MRYRRRTIKYFIIIHLFISVTSLSADSSNFDYDHIAASVFWKELYTYGGWTLYCGYKFGSDLKTEHAKSINIEHIYPSNWMFKQVGCDSRMQCRESKNKHYLQMEADMHNMYPVWQKLVIFRYNLHYGIVSGEEWRFDDCDFEWKSGIVEPRPLARGNIARSIFYMHSRYGVLIDADMINLLKAWNREDPPSDQERERNVKIERIQGERNPYIDNPSLVERIMISAQH